MIEEVEIQEPEQQQPDPPKKKLWRKLNTDRLYTKSYKDFEQQFNTPERISKLYQSLSSQKLYTKTQPEFEQQFFQSEKKKLRGSVDFSGSSLQAGDALSQSSGEVGAEIPQIEMYKVGEDLIPTDPLSLSKKLNELSTRTKEVSMPSSGKGGQLLTSMPDEEAKKTAKKLQEDFKDLDLGGIYEETKDLSEDIVANHGKRLMSERKDNPQLYQRDLSNIKWRSGFEKQLLEYVDNGFLKPNEYNNIKHGIKQLPISTSEGDFTNQRSTIKSMADAIRLFGGDKKDDILKNFAVEVSKVYGNAYDNKFSESVKDSPESKYLNEDEQLGLQYLKDVDPDKAEQYNRILIDPKTIKDNPDAVKGANHLHQVLEETSLGLQQNAVTEELNNLYNIGKRNNGLDPEQLQRAGKLDKRQEEINQKRQELDKKYPERITSKIDDAMQEIFGQTADPIGYLHGKAVTGVAHTVQGIWESVSTPFMSDQSNTIRELSIMGERLKEDYTFHKTDKNKAIQYDELIIEPDLKAEIDAVMKNLGLSEERKRSIVNEYLKNNTDKFGRVAIHSSKFNVNPSSILYGLTDLGTSLLPFIGLEVATGGIGGAGAAAKFIRTFTAAAATTFHDEYAASIQEGKPQSEAYKRAMYTTAINSAAMAGAGTPTEVRTMLGSKSSAAKIIARLSDAEIKKVMAEGTPKGLRAIGQSLNNRAKATPTLLSQGLKTGAKFEGAMAGAAELTDREHDWKQAVLGIANFGILGAALGHFGYKSPTELQKGGLVEMGRKPKEFRATLDQMKKDGQINEAEFLHRTDLIDKAEESYKIIPKANDKGQPLDEKQKSEYLYNLVIKNEGKKEAVNLPPKQAEKAEHTSMVADYKNSHLLEEPTDKQLESRQSKLEKDLEKKDEEGKFELTDKDRKTAQAELDAIKETLEKNKKEVVEPETKPTPPTDVKVEPTNTDNVVEGSGGVGGDVDATAKEIENNPSVISKVSGDEYYHGTSLPKSEVDFTTANKEKGVGVRSNAFMGTSREQKSPFFFITSERSVANDFAQAKKEYHDDKLKPTEKHTSRIIPFKFDEENSKVLDLTKDDYEFVLQDIGESPIDFFGMGMYEQDQMWEMLDEPKFADKLKSLGYDAVKFIEPKRGIGIAVLNTDKIVNTTPKGIAEAYHKAKKDGTNPKLVKAVEQSLKETTKAGSVGVVDVKDTFENREAIEDNLKDLGDNVYYHGSDDISYLNSKEDLNTAENTKNAESKYLNLSPKASVAVSYSIRQQKISEKSGVAAFKLKGNGYTMKDADIKKLKSNADYEAFYDKKKSEGYDYVKVPQDANDIVVLNNNAIEYVGKKLNREAVEQSLKETPQAGSVGVGGDVNNTEFGERKIKPKKVISTKDLKEGDNDFGNAAQVSDDGSIIVYHVTDNDNLVNSLTAGKNPKDTYNTDGSKREELGSGVYGSAVPEYWANRSANKYGFLKDLPKEKQKSLANKIKDTLNQYISKGYITPTEYEYGVKSVREYEKSGNENQLLSVSGQPYNIRFWENDYLKDLGIENNGIPNVVAIKAKGNFVEFTDAPYLTKADVDKLIASGVDGAFVGGGFVNNPELVIFNKDAIQGYRVDKLKEIDFQNKNFKAVEQSLKETPKADNVVEGKPTDVVVDEGVVDKSEKIEEDKDTYLSEGIQNVAKNKQASDLLKVAMNRDVIPERVYNDFGKELAAIKITPKSKTAIVEVAELIQKYSDVKNEKTDSFIKEQNQAIENADFEKRAYADMTAQEKFEAKIEDKSHTSEKLTPEELQFVNETYFAPKGYRYNENFGLVKSKKNKPEIKNEEAKVTEDTKQAEGVIKPEKNVVEDAQQTGSGKEPPKETSEQVGEEGWQNGITHAANEVRRKDRLLPEYEKEPQTFEAWNNEAEQKIKDGYDVEKLMTEIEKGKDPNPVENAIRKIYIATLDAEIAKNPTDALLAKQKRFIEIGDLANSRAGRNLVSLKGEGSPLSTISDFYVAKMEAMGVEKLTEEQKAEVKKQYDYVQKTNQEAADKIQKLEEENAKLRAEAAVRKTASSTKKQNKDYKKERQDLVQSIKDKWKNAGSDTLSSDIPYRQQLFAIAPDVAKLMKSYIEEGVTEFGEIIKRLHATIKEVEQRVTEKDVSDILSGKYDAPKETKTDLLQKLRQIKNKRSEEAVKILAKIKSGDFAKEEKAVSWVENMDLKKKFPKEYNAALDAIKVKEDARHEFDIALFRDQLSRRTTGEKITDNLSKTAGTIKAITTGIDDSAVAIQTYVSMLVRPRTGVKAFYQHIRQGFSQKKFDRWLSALHNTPDFKEMRDMGLDITEPSSLKEREKEEIFNNRFSGTIKVKGKEYKLLDAPLKPFERAFTTLGNVTRVVGYRTISKKYKNEGYTVEKDPELFKSLAKRLNTETGRGEVNEYVDMANKVVTMGIWSPKLMAQKFNILGISDLASLVLSKAGTKGYYRQLHPKERAAAIRDVAQFATTVMALSYGFAFAFGGDIDTDPLSSTFMDIKMPNGKSYNFTGGFSGYIRAISQFAMGEKHKDGKVIKIGRLETAGRFFRGKTPPLTTAGLNLAAGKNFMGEPTTVGGEIVNLAPISLRGIVSQINNDGANAFFTQGIPSFFGFNVKNEKDYRTKSQLAGEEFAKANPDLKVFIDKGISLPEYDPEKIQVEEVNGKVTEHLSDYSKETQDAYIKAHQGYYKEELTNLKNGTSLIYKDEKGTVHIDIDPQDQSGMDYVEFSKLTDDEIKYLEGQISRKVSIKTKNEIDFKNRKKKQ